MGVDLKWVGDALLLGRTKMAEIRTREDIIRYEYVLGPGDKVSDPYQRKEDARQDCELEMRRLLRKAGA